ncbi:hypothetical protein LIER_39408 [Lithospermum erythrorhizon]|uniref:Uncharacterized protein n=1 Tax=Lithospermum erythrorhizon TaxID=34254 RepID=A0AAV3QIN8_LITER
MTDDRRGVHKIYKNVEIKYSGKMKNRVKGLIKVKVVVDAAIEILSIRHDPNEQLCLVLLSENLNQLFRIPFNDYLPPVMLPSKFYSTHSATKGVSTYDTLPKRAPQKSSFSFLPTIPIAPEFIVPLKVVSKLNFMYPVLGTLHC